MSRAGGTEKESGMGPSPAPLADRFENAVDLGQGHSLIWLYRRPSYWPEGEAWDPAGAMFPDDVYAVIEQHPDAGDPSRYCEGVVYLRHPYDHLTAHVWKVNSWEPLDIDPSILCERCGSHGYVHAGKWDPV